VTRIVPYLIFLLVAVCILGGMHYYVWARLIRDTHPPPPMARAFTVALVLLGLLLPATIAIVRATRGNFAAPLVWVAFLWLGVAFLLTAFLGFADLGRALGWATRALAAPREPADPSRRVFLSRVFAAGVGGTVAALTGFGLRSALGSVRIKEVPVRLRNLPRELDGFGLVQITDLHIGPLLHRGWVEGVVEKVRALRADAVAITGDLVDGSVEELRRHVAPLARLAEAPRGAFFVTGNHEYYSGVDEWLGYLPTLGIRPLHNERVELAPGLDLAGIPDPTGRGLPGHAPDLPRALAGRDPGRPVVLLAHQPRQFLEAAHSNVSLTLCGHTHGGQIWPFSWVVALVQPYVAGLHRKGESQLYVSRGTGFWGPPMRIFAPPEITLLRLRAA
jgi:predicted MPP superfamily phosphohydrolase